MTLWEKRPLPGLFDEDYRLEYLNKIGGPLERLNAFVDWEVFRPMLEQSFRRASNGLGGLPTYDYVIMFKVLFLQSSYNLADGTTQFMIVDRLSFQRFLGLRLSDAVPDEKTIWYFRNRLAEAEVIGDLFDAFKAVLADAGFQMKTGSIIDARIVDDPKQHPRKSEKKPIENGEKPEDGTNMSSGSWTTASEGFVCGVSRSTARSSRSV